MKWILFRSYFVFWIDAPICQMFHCLLIVKLIPVLLANSYPSIELIGQELDGDGERGKKEHRIIGFLMHVSLSTEIL